MSVDQGPFIGQAVDMAEAPTSESEPLEGGWQTDVRRVGNTVLRTSGPQSPSVIRLLMHLEANGFDAAPRPIGGGFAAGGREQLSFEEGRSPQPLAWSNEAAWHIGVMLRRLHDVTSTFVTSEADLWRPWFARSLPGDMPVIGHGDLAPWNVLAVNGMPSTFIDWDNAGPVDATWELAQVAWLNAQLVDDDVAELNGLPNAATRIEQCAAILDGYGLAKPQRSGFADKMIEFAVRSAKDEAMTYEVIEATPSPAPDGFPLLWGVTWRTRAACWILDHRTEIERAIS